MSVARPVLKNTSLMLTRRVRNRTFLLRPDPRTNQVIGYVVAVMQKKWNILLHALCAMSDHWHVCLTDPDGNIVEFERDCHHFIARGLNALHQDEESVWNTSQSNRVECVAPSDLLDKMAYTMGNPVEAGLVYHGRSWPGVRCAWPCEPRTFRRPSVFFRGEKEGGQWPEEAVLEMTRPPGYEELSGEELADIVSDRIDTHEENVREKYIADGGEFLGRAGVLRQSRYRRAASKEVRFGTKPKVACRDKTRRIERLAFYKDWQCAYRWALHEWRCGNRAVRFPAGTYKMRVVHGAICETTPD